VVGAIASGTQVLPTVSVPVNLGGNAISVLGDSSAEGASAPAATTSTGSGDATTSGSDGVAGGTQVLPTVSVPVNVGGNAISVLGDSTSEGASAPAATTGSSTGSTGGATTTGSDSVAGGTQIAPDVALPVSVGGNAISILGDAASTGSSTPAAQEGTDGGVTTTGDDGILGGTQVVPSVTLPVTIGGNAISVLGDSAVTGGATGAVAPADPTDPIDPTDPVLPTGPTAGSNGTGGSTVVATGFTGGGTAAALGSATTAALSVQALASTGADIAPLVGLIGLLLAAGIALLVIARRRTV
jgi:LPXTG-motif cell wall-anchored protein